MFRKHAELLGKVRGELLTCGRACVLSRVRLFVTPWTVAHQAPPPMEFSRQEHWSGLPFPTPGSLPNLGTEPVSCTGTQILYHYTTWEALSWSLKDMKLQINGKVLCVLWWETAKDYGYAGEGQQSGYSVCIPLKYSRGLWGFQWSRAEDYGHSGERNQRIMGKLKAFGGQYCGFTSWLSRLQAM